MATSLSASVTAGMSWTYVTTGTNPSTNQNSFSYAQSFVNGTALNQADLLYVTTGTIAASGSLNVDLNAAVNDFFGNSVVMLRLKAMYVQLTTDTAAASILIGNGTNPLINWVGSGTHTVRVRNGGVLVLCAPDATAYAITAGTGDVLKFLNEDGSNTATYKLGFIGASA